MCSLSLFAQIILKPTTNTISHPLRISCLDFAGLMEYRPTYSIFIPKVAVTLVVAI